MVHCSKPNQLRANLVKVSCFPSLFVPRMAPKWSMHSMGYYSAVKKDELLARETAGMNLKCIKLNGSS